MINLFFDIQLSDFLSTNMIYLLAKVSERKEIIKYFKFLYE